MGRRLVESFVESVEGKARRTRAEWILALRDLQLSGRRACTLAEWLETWPSQGDPDRDELAREVAAKAQRKRLRRALREHGLTLEEQTPEDGGLEIGVGTPALRRLVALELPVAERVLEIADPDAVENPARVVADYGMFSASLARIGRARRIHQRTVRRILVAAGKPIRGRGRPRVEATLPRDVVERARRLVREHASVSAIARALGDVSRAAARAFRERVLRSSA